MGWKDIFIGRLGKGNRGERAHKAALKIVNVGNLNDIGQIADLSPEQVDALAKEVRRQEGKSALSWIVLSWIKFVVRNNK